MPARGPVFTEPGSRGVESWGRGHSRGLGGGLLLDGGLVTGDRVGQLLEEGLVGRLGVGLLLLGGQLLVLAHRKTSSSVLRG